MDMFNYDLFPSRIRSKRYLQHVGLTSNAFVTGAATASAMDTKYAALPTGQHPFPQK
jgi:hypothetical protein